MIVRWASKAAAQLFEAGDYLAAQRPDWDERLYAASRNLTLLIAAQPRAFAAIDDREPNVRKALVPDYQYWIIYEIREASQECFVLAFWPTNRRPEGWRRGR